MDNYYYLLPINISAISMLLSLSNFKNQVHIMQQLLVKLFAWHRQLVEL